MTVILIEALILLISVGFLVLSLTYLKDFEWLKYAWVAIVALYTFFFAYTIYLYIGAVLMVY